MRISDWSSDVCSSDMVDFGWAASALDYDDISGCAQAAIGGKDGIQQFALAASVIFCAQGALHLSMDDDLRGLVRLGLQQDRVHVRMKFRTAGEGLQGLSPADLPAVRRHRRVVGHVLWLAGQDATAAIRNNPAHPGPTKT